MHLFHHDFYKVSVFSNDYISLLRINYSDLNFRSLLKEINNL